MEDTFIESLPDEIPGIPVVPGMTEYYLPSLSPKAFMEKLKEFQVMANAHAVEQADSVADFVEKHQQQITEVTAEAVDNAEAKADEKAEEKAEENKEEEEKSETGEEDKAEAKEGKKKKSKK